MKTVAVFGAGGFVGATCVEHLLARGAFAVRPYIHSTGGAWRLSPLGIELRRADLTRRESVREALHGCTHVVNASRGEADVMLGGLDHLLEESLAAGIERFVHLSSVSAWGSARRARCCARADAPSALLSGYGRTKLEQDRRVAAACRKGLPCLSLAPPYISGAYSPFILSVVNALRAETLALVEGGELPCSLVDVQNLAQAIERALLCPVADGRRLFVTDGDARTWRALVVRLSRPREGRSLPAVPHPGGGPAARGGAGASRVALGHPALAGGDRRGTGDAPDPRRGPVARPGLSPRGRCGARRREATAAVSARGVAAPALREAAQASRLDRHLLGVQLRAVRHADDAAGRRSATGPRSISTAAWMPASRGTG